MKRTHNTFKKGLVADIDTLMIDNEALIQARNIDFLTQNGAEQLVLQKRPSYVMDVSLATILSGEADVIKAVKVLNDIAYIISYNKEIGNGLLTLSTYPSPFYAMPVEYEDLRTYMVDECQPLHNFYSGYGDINDDANYNEAFQTELITIKDNVPVDLELQVSYDGSVNMVFATEGERVRIVNSRFRVDEDGNATRIKRKAKKSNNTYSNEAIHQTELIPRSVGVPRLSLDGVFEGGILFGGGYRYYFKYITADGSETDIIEESRLVPIHIGNRYSSSVGLKGTQRSNKAVRFKLSGLDQSFYGLRIYYTHYTGEAAVSGTSYSIDKTYIIEDSVAYVTHTGYEVATPVTAADINQTYSPISYASTLSTINNRLLLGNSSYTVPDNKEYARMASSIKPTTFNFPVTAASKVTYSPTGYNNYAYPGFTHDRLGYWRGETYEFGVRFITKNGITPVYPTHGLDGIRSTTYINSLVGILYDGFTGPGQNCQGVYRVPKNYDDFLGKKSDYYFNGVGINMDLSYMRENLFEYVPGEPYANPLDIIGFFFVRRTRKKDKLMSGVMVPAASVRTTPQYDREIGIYGGYVGYGKRISVSDDALKTSDLKYVPVPYCSMPFGSASLVRDINDQGSADFLIQGRPASPTGNRWWAMYAPDIETAPAESNALFTGGRYGLAVSTFGVYAGFDITTEFSPALSSNMPIGIKFLDPPLKEHNTSRGPYHTEISCTYISTGQAASASGSMTGVSDRNITLNWDSTSMKEMVSSSGSDIKEVIDKYGDKNALVCKDDLQIQGKPGASVKYGQYLAINLGGAANSFIYEPISPPFSGSAKQLCGYMSLDNVHVWSTDSSKYSYEAPEIYAHIVDIHATPNGNGVLSSADWQNRYDVNDDSTGYVAISPRYSVEDILNPFPVEVYGGDCYLGAVWKQAWAPFGVDGIPQASDIHAYKEDARKALGLLNYGFAALILGQSNHNMHLRVPEEVESEKDLYGKPRSYYPHIGRGGIRGNRQVETSLYNFGYSAYDYTDNAHFRTNSDAQYFNYKYPNRVYASDIDLTNQYANGYTVFKGLSFKDYNPELGPIVAIRKIGNKAIIVFSGGIAAVNVDEKQMVSETGGVFIEGGQALSISSIISKQIGAEDSRSVIATKSHVYGYDASTTSVWRTDGETFEDISTFKVQSELHKLKQQMITTGTYSVVTNVDLAYDRIKGDVYVSFYGVNPETNTMQGRAIPTSLIYNELLNIWVCASDDIAQDIIIVGDTKYNVQPYDSVLYKYYTPGEDESAFELNSYNDFPSNFNKQHHLTQIPEERQLGRYTFDASITYVMNGDNSSTNKHLTNILVYGDHVMPHEITYESEDLVSPLTQVILPYTNVQLDMFKAPIIPDTPPNSAFVEANSYGNVIKLKYERKVVMPHTSESLQVGDPISIKQYDQTHCTYVTGLDKYKLNSVYVIERIHLATPVHRTIKYSDGSYDKLTDGIYLGFSNNLRQSNASSEGNFVRVQTVCKYTNLQDRSAPERVVKLKGKQINVKLLFTGGGNINLKGVESQYLEYFY